MNKTKRLASSSKAKRHFDELGATPDRAQKRNQTLADIEVKVMDMLGEEVLVVKS